AGSSGSGNGQVNFSVAVNTATSDRSGTLTVAGQTVTIAQSGAPAPTPTCVYAVSPSALSFAASDGSATINVTASPADCQWTATSSQPWVTVTSGQTGQGNRVVNYNVAANPTSSARTAQVTVAGLSGQNPPATHTITQSAGGGSLQPYDYVAFDGTRVTLYPVTGVHVALLVPSPNLDLPTLTRLVGALDAIYTVYQSVTGREPSPYFTYRGLATVASVP